MTEHSYETELERQRERLSKRPPRVTTVNIEADQIHRYAELIGGELGARLMQCKADHPGIRLIPGIEFRTLDERVAYAAAWKTIMREDNNGVY